MFKTDLYQFDFDAAFAVTGKTVSNIHRLSKIHKTDFLFCFICFSFLGGDGFSFIIAPQGLAWKKFQRSNPNAENSYDVCDA